MLAWTAGAEAQQEDESGYNQAYYLTRSLNAGLAPLQPPPNLFTPQASLENFMLSARLGDFDRAARSLNLDLIPEDRRSVRAADLARKLFYLINQQLWIDWDTIPDRADGQRDRATSKNDPLAGQPRRSIEIGSMTLHGRDAAVRLQRVKGGEDEPVWVFSPQSVENIDPLYAQYGPGFLEQHLPAWSKERVWVSVPLWEWLALPVFFVVAAACGWIIQRVIALAARRTDGDWLPRLVRSARLPAALFFGLLVVYILTFSALTLTGPIHRIVSPLLIVLMIAAVTWAGMRAIKFTSEYVTDVYILGDRDRGIDAGVLLTNISIARRVLILIALLAGAGIALSQIGAWTSLGVSLLASAGVATILIGVAARSVLGNILAGVQIAISKPVTIGDSILFEGNWGWVEDITYTYLSVRTWDQRRLVVPLNYFLSHPVENWSMADPAMIKPIYLYADYRIDVDKVRKAFAEMLEKDEDWDRASEPTVQVTGANEETVELRALCSAEDPSTAWTLHCRLREKLVAFVRDLEGGAYLPTRRIFLQNERIGIATRQEDSAAKPDPGREGDTGEHRQAAQEEDDRGERERGAARAAAR